jgi:hypothetical protein
MVASHCTWRLEPSADVSNCTWMPQTPQTARGRLKVYVDMSECTVWAAVRIKAGDLNRILQCGIVKSCVSIFDVGGFMRLH